MDTTRVWKVITVSLCLVFFTASRLFGGDSHSQDKSYSPTPDQITLAILYFENKGTAVELNPLEKSLTQMLITDLSGIEGVRVVERGRIRRLLEDIHLTETGLVDYESAQIAGKALQADYLLLGAFQGDATDITFNIKLCEVQTKREIPFPEIKGSSEDIFRIESDILSKICELLGIDATVRKEPARPSPGKKPTLAVMYFQNLSLTGRLDPLQKGFTDMFLASLSDFQEITVVEREELQKAIEELNLTISGLADQHNALRVGKMLGVQVVLLGSFMEFGDSLRIDTHLVDVDTGLLIKAESAVAKEEEFASLLRDLAVMIVEDLQIEVSSSKKEQVTVPSTNAIEAVLHYSRALDYLDRSKFEKAIEECKKAVYIDPKYYEPQRTICEIYLWNLSDEIKAVEELLICLERFPNDTWALTFLGHGYSHLGEYGKSVQVWKQLISRYGTNTVRGTDFRFNLAWTYSAMRKYEDALRTYEEILNTAKDLTKRVQASVWRYRLYAKNLQLPEKAVAEFERAVNYALPQNVHHGRGWLGPHLPRVAKHYCQLKQWDRAHDMLRGFVEKFSNLDVAGEAIVEDGHIYYAQGDYERAIERFEEAIQLYPNNKKVSEAQYWIGKSHEMRREVREACLAYRMAVNRHGQGDEWGQKAFERLRIIGSGETSTDKQAQSVLIDEAHGQSRTKDFGNFGQSALRKALLEAGFVVHVRSKRNREPWQRSLADYDVLILNGIYPSTVLAYTRSEIEGIRQFVFAGGRLLVALLGDQSRFGEDRLTYDSIISIFGVTVDREKHLSRGKATWLAKHPISTEFYFFGGTGLRCTRSMEDIATYKGIPILAAGRYGRGKVVVAGIGCGFMNTMLASFSKGPENAKRSQANERLLLNIMSWFKKDDEPSTQNPKLDFSPADVELLRLAETAEREASSSPNKALKWYQSLVDQYPSSPFAPLAQLRIGYCYIRQNDWENARIAFQKVTNNYEPGLEKMEAMLWLGYCYEREEKYGDAARIYNELLKIYPVLRVRIENLPYVPWEIIAGARGRGKEIWPLAITKERLKGIETFIE